MEMSHVKWYAERLDELLQQDPNCRTTTELARAVDLFLHTSGIERLEANIPPGLRENGE